MTQAAMENTEKIVKQKEKLLNKQSSKEGNQANFGGMPGRMLSDNDMNQQEKPK